MSTSASKSKSLSLYTEDLWKEFVGKNTGELKTYLHFDHIFDFDKHQEKIRKLVADPSLKSISSHGFLPFLKILIKTPRYKYQVDTETYGLETKIRPISFASHFDTYIYAFYAFCLTKKYEDYIKGRCDGSVLAYRTDLNGDCNIQFAKLAFDKVKELSAKNGSCIAIALDIAGYFDNIEHKVLKENWCTVIGDTELPIDQFKVYKSLTGYSYSARENILKHFKINKNTRQVSTLLDLIPDAIAGAGFIDKFNLLRERNLIVKNKEKRDKRSGKMMKKGIPQGSSMSSVLSNIYLLKFDIWLSGLAKRRGFHYLRYCDDLLVICPPEQAKIRIKEITEEIWDHYHLEIQEKKSEIIEFREDKSGKLRAFNAKTRKARASSKGAEEKHYKNLQYLGFEFNGHKIYLRPSSLSRYFRKAKGRIVKTMMMAYGKRSKEKKIFKKQLYERYTHFGKRNFITYAQNAAKKEYRNSKKVIKEGMDSPSIRRQLSQHLSILEKEFVKTSRQFSANKKVPFKY